MNSPRRRGGHGGSEYSKDLRVLRASVVNFLVQIGVYWQFCVVMQLNHQELTQKVIGCAIEVHRELGPGLLESAYQQCLAYELSQKGFAFEMEKSQPVLYKGVRIDCDYRLDLVVEKTVLLELKSVAALDPIHDAQIITYLKLSKLPVGLLMNFNVEVLKNGIKRFVR
jgi:GxxExxY protein